MKEWKWSLVLLPMISVQSAMPTFTFLVKPITLTGFVQIASCSSGTSSCKCPLCRRPITLLIPTEHSLSQRHDPEVAQILSKIHAYNRVFGGQSSSFFKAASGDSSVSYDSLSTVLCLCDLVVISSRFALARFSPSLAVAVGRNLAVSGGRVVPPSVVALFLLCSCDLFRTHLRPARDGVSGLNEEYWIPVPGLMSEDSTWFSMSKAFHLGAIHYFLKPFNNDKRLDLWAPLLKHYYDRRNLKDDETSDGSEFASDRESDGEAEADDTLHKKDDTLLKKE
ncbi:uncharacterized protein HKW66_Vig0010720 [Vigna angularis]|uniref:Uncharacterized protein n=1 Tax=Phaseolus angularis TaxID=3914 RepID=A0A8T0LEH4_PHAAN|nr:uncharacterized protein HKW66_Vig0010720 [Vigna angularis]